MRISWISLADYRSYDTLEWEPHPDLSILVGPNAAGKTNLLEAIGYLGFLRSFRGADDAQVVRRGSRAAVLRAEVKENDRSGLIEIEIPIQGRKRVLLNRRRLNRREELTELLRIVVFLPDDLDIVKRGPVERRRFLDELAAQLWPGTARDQAEYERALRQRNAFLKRGDRDPVTWEVWDERLARAGAKLVQRRTRALEAVAGHVEGAYLQVAGSGRVRVDYTTTWAGTPTSETSVAELTAHLRTALERRRRVDAERGMTTVGPHRDEPMILVDDRDGRYLASQGEQRTVALALRLASHRAIEEVTGVRALLLLDDVFSELDADRAAALREALPVAQTIITTVVLDSVPMAGVVYRVGDGKVVAA